MADPCVSIVFPTANRLPYLRVCMDSVRANLGDLSYEFVVVDGGSTDGTAEYLEAAQDVQLIQHGTLLGSNKAFRDGLKAARGEYVCQLSDDVEVIDGCIPSAVDLLRANPHYGQVAFAYQNPGCKPGHMFATMRGKRVLACAFGVTPKRVGDLVDWWSPEYYTQYGDPDFSCKIWQAGYEVAALPVFYIIHHMAERPPELRKYYREDSQTYGLKWG